MGRIQIDDGELHYDIQGEGSPVVLLHGGGLTHRMWDDQVPLLAPHHTVIRYDSCGHGESYTPTTEYADYRDLKQLLDGLGIPKTTLIGHSLGGRIAIDFAVTYPEMVDRLVLVGTGISGTTFTDPFVLAEMDKLLKAGDLPTIVECILRMWVDGPRREPSEVNPEIREQCRSWISDNFTKHGKATMLFRTELHAVERAGELTSPTLLLVGDLDSSDIHGVVDLVEREAPDARKVVVPGVAHNVNLERPDEFTKTLLEFLA